MMHSLVCKLIHRKIIKLHYHPFKFSKASIFAKMFHYLKKLPLKLLCMEKAFCLIRMDVGGRYLCQQKSSFWFSAKFCFFFVSNEIDSDSNETQSRAEAVAINRFQIKGSSCIFLSLSCLSPSNLLNGMRTSSTTAQRLLRATGLSYKRSKMVNYDASFIGTTYGENLSVMAYRWQLLHRKLRSVNDYKIGQRFNV